MEHNITAATLKDVGNEHHESVSPIRLLRPKFSPFIELTGGDEGDRKASMSAARDKLKEYSIFVAANSEYTFNNLYDKIDFSLLQLAESKVRDQSAWGLDSVLAKEYGCKADIDLRILADEIATDTYIPRKAIQFVSKGRELSKIAIRDKVLQKAVSLLLAPIFKPQFHDYCVSSGVRSDKIAVRVKEILRRKKTRVAFRADITKFFPSIDKVKMMTFLRKRISDKRILNLITLWLDMELIGPNGTFYKSYEYGILQGSPIAPLLADIYLHFVVDDWVWANRKEVTAMVRYVDDMLFAFSSHHAYKKFRDDLEARLSEFNLKLSGALKKTRAISLDHCGVRTKAFRFLGYSHFISARSTPAQAYQRSLRKIISRPSLQSVAKYRGRLSTMFAREHYPRIRRDDNSYLRFTENEQLAANIGGVLRGFVRAYATSYQSLKKDSKKIVWRTIKWALDSWFEEYRTRMALYDLDEYSKSEAYYLIYENDWLCQRIHFNYVLIKYRMQSILRYYSEAPLMSLKRHVQCLKILAKRGGDKRVDPIEPIDLRY